MEAAACASGEVTTLTLVKYSSLRSKLWAFGMMQFAHRYLSDVPGLRFYKLMGSGRGLGFSLMPDWSVYAMLQVWEHESAAIDFLRSNSLMSQYNTMGSERVTLFLKTISSHGEWSRQHPFQHCAGLSDSTLPVAVITRASIKTSELVRFWQYVPTAEKPIAQAQGLIYTKGLGEMPIKQMATFSIWETPEAMEQYAYKSPEHRMAVQLTRERGWFQEELFARFQLYRTMGSMQEIPIRL